MIGLSGALLEIETLFITAAADRFDGSAFEVVLQNDDDDDSLLGAIAGFFAGLWMIYSGVKKYQKHRLIKNTATEKVRSMAVGRTELEGIANEIDEPLSQPFTDDDCLYADWSIREYTEDDDDDESWETIDSGSYAEPFILDDDTGRVVVDAETDTTWKLSGELSRQWTISSGNRPDDTIAQFCQSQDISPTSSNRRRYKQTVLPPETSVYVFGESRPRDLEDEVDLTDAGQRLKIVRDSASGKFIISDRGEEELASYYGKKAPTYIIAGLALSAICLYGILTI